MKDYDTFSLYVSFLMPCTTAISQTMVSFFINQLILCSKCSVEKRVVIELPPFVRFVSSLWLGGLKIKLKSVWAFFWGVQIISLLKHGL